MWPNTENKHSRSLPPTLRLIEERSIVIVHLLRQQKLRGLLFFFYDLLCIEDPLFFYDLLCIEVVHMQVYLGRVSEGGTRS
jgi:hypothetical protein